MRAGVELGEVDDEGHRRLALAAGKEGDLGDEFGVREGRRVRDLHDHGYHGHLTGLWVTHWAAQRQ